MTPEVPATGARAVLRAAEAAKASVEAQQAFHDARVAWALDALEPIKTQWDGLAAQMAAVTGKITQATDMLDSAKEACKVAAFLGAQKARVDAQAAVEAANLKSAEVKTAYDAQSAFATDGAVNTLCNYPTPAEGEAQQPRTACLEGEPGKPLCCGAAQRFLKDGTKLSIETCQLATDTTYT